MSETTAPLPSAVSATSTGPRTLTAGRGRARIALRGLEVLLALFYGIASALPKLIAHPSAAESFDKLGWGDTGMYAIGVLELAGAIALLVPVLRSVAAVSLGALMVGAFIVTIVAFDGENAATPLILLVPLGLIAWARRDSVKDLARLVRRTP
ncbi:DoxX family protein [Streptomyces sp. ID05-47C]|uniref:DoxX family protein n=1 Tax=Streptomyces sp. ID05-47C TaxID=3028665 RepID=UPI0029A9D675|nr:DoxX family protein [Streptomyces sp. ID05-47C]MDX3574402.1 DoxX family protein [Streptomyces sp. ID05-47C]